MRTIPLATDAEPKFLFVRPDGGEAVVATMGDVVGSGRPRASDGPYRGTEMGYVGRVDPGMPAGAVDLAEYDLPDPAKGYVALCLLGAGDDPDDEPEEHGRTVMFRQTIEVAAYESGRRLPDVPLTAVEVQAETEGVTVYLPARDEDFSNDPAYLLVERRPQGWTTYVYPGHGRPVTVAVVVADDGTVTLGADEPGSAARSTP